MLGSSPQVTWHSSQVGRPERHGARGGGATVWLTGLPASGKSTLAALVEQALLQRGQPAYLLDGDNLRHGLNSDLDFTAPGRSENVRRVAHVARLFADAGLIAVVSLISPYRADRDAARGVHENDGLPFVEVFVDTPVQECERRDPKGLYARARRGELRGLTGIDDPYEPPGSAEVVVRPIEHTRARALAMVLQALEQAAASAATGADNGVASEEPEQNIAIGPRAP